MNIEAQSRALRQLAAQLVRDEAKADDLVQDTWIDALQHPPSRGRPAGPWLRTVLRNRRVSNLRAQARRTRREQARQPPVHPASAEQIQLGRELLEHLAELPEADRDLLTLRYWEALTLNECAGRLGISASTARTRHARALHKLRDRLDTRTGGREAWLSALAPWVVNVPPPVVAAAPPLSLASLSVGGVVAGACLWLVSGLNPGCGTEIETTAPPDAEQKDAARDPDPIAFAEAGSATKSHRGAPPAFELDFDAEKHPCEMPIAPTDAPSMAEVLESGETLSSKQLVAALLECEKLHGPSADYLAPNANADESVHPLLSATMSMRQIWPAMRDCYPASEPASVRASFSFWLNEDGAMTVDNIKTLRSEGLNADQIACVENSISVAETDLRNGDPEKMGLPAGTVLEMPRIFEIELKDSATKVTGSGFRPPSHLKFRDKAAYEEQLARCASEPMAATLHWDPETGELLNVTPDRAAGPEAGACLAELLESQLKPRQTQFFPRTDADTLQQCTFQGGKASCKTQPLFRVVTR